MKKTEFYFILFLISLILAYFLYEIKIWFFWVFIIIGIFFVWESIMDKIFQSKTIANAKKDIGKIKDANPKYPKGVLDKSFKKSMKKIADYTTENTEVKIFPISQKAKQIIEDIGKMFK